MKYLSMLVVTLLMLMATSNSAHGQLKRNVSVESHLEHTSFQLKPLEQRAASSSAPTQYKRLFPLEGKVHSVFANRSVQQTLVATALLGTALNAGGHYSKDHRHWVHQGEFLVNTSLHLLIYGQSPSFAEALGLSMMAGATYGYLVNGVALGRDPSHYDLRVPFTSTDVDIPKIWADKREAQFITGFFIYMWGLGDRLLND